MTVLKCDFNVFFIKIIKNSIPEFTFKFRENLVPMAGLEPAQLSPLPPQDSVSTNSTTSANVTCN